MRKLLYWDPKVREPLQRQGSRIMGGGRRWEMMGVHGPLEIKGGDGQYFRIDTSADETLLVYRDPGEKGMRALYLLAVVDAQKAG